MDNVSFLLWLCAVSGTAFFALRLLLSVAFGVHHDMGGMHDGGHHDMAAETDFKLVSFYTIFAFFMMFGWSGLAAYQQFNLGSLPTFFIAVTSGTVTMVMVAYLLSLFSKFTSSGDTFTPEKIIGEKASVYERIPPSGSGVIHITYGGLLREVKAVSEDKSEIDSFVEVIVCALVEPEIVSVRRVKS